MSGFLKLASNDYILLVDGVSRIILGLFEPFYNFTADSKPFDFSASITNFNFIAKSNIFSTIPNTGTLNFIATARAFNFSVTTGT